MVLWSSSGSSTSSDIGDTIAGVSEDLVDKEDVVAYNTGSQMVRHAFTGLQNLWQRSIVILCDYLKRSKDLCGTGRKMLFGENLVQGHKHCRGLDSTVLRRNGVIGKFLASEQQLCARNLLQPLGVRQDVIRSVCKHRSNREILAKEV